MEFNPESLHQDAQAGMDMSSTSLPESRRHGVNGAHRELPLTDGQRIDEERGDTGDDRQGGDDGRPGTKSRFGKWVQVATADDSVSDAARRSLQATLAAVQHYLPLAANQASQDIEYVHQLRVFTRRSMAVIEIFGELLPKQHAKWLNRKLRQIRRAAGRCGISTCWNCGTRTITASMHDVFLSVSTSAEQRHSARLLRSPSGCTEIIPSPSISKTCGMQLDGRRPR